MKTASLLGAATLAAAALSLTACQGGPFRASAATTENLQPRRDALLAAADWSRVIEVTVQMHDYGYRPRELRLKSGQPYRITLVNYGGANHYFTAPEFLAASATRKAEVRNQAEVKAPVFTSFEVFARGGSIDLYLVPMIKGQYRAHCHMRDHEKLNIEGLVIIE